MTPLSDDRGELVGVLGVARDITERKRAEDALKESELRFKALHNASFGGIAIHDKGLILDCNQGLSDITGYTTEELIGMDGLLLIAESFRGVVMQHILEGYEKPYEAFGIRKNGKEYPIMLEAKNIPYKGKMSRVVEFRDITSRKRAELKLKDSERRHRVIFENSPLGVVRFSKEGTILDCNDNFVALMGSSKEALVGFTAERQGNLKMYDALAMAMAGQASSYEDYYTSVTGDKTIFLHAQFNPVNPGQSPTEVIATMEDFGERKEAQDELKRAKEEAEAYSRSKTEFLTNMSHEIRTPLNGIMGMLQLMQTTGLDDEQSEYNQAALQSSRRLMNLLADILDLSRVEAGKMVVQRTPFDLPKACEQVCEMFRLTSAQPCVALKCDFAVLLPRTALGDAVRLQQVLTNLVGNAFKFTTHGHIVLSAHRLPDVSSNEFRILFSVSDTGVGISDSELGTLFDPFTQVSRGYTRTHQGAGLGLSICKRLVNLMGGSMTIESEEGVGTTLYFAIPFGRSEQLPQASLSENRGQAVVGKSFDVLLAEDERVNSLVTRRILEKDGHAVTAVENGRQAIEALQARNYDVVLMDIQMPEMDGVEATRAIRAGLAGEARASIPIIAVTAYAMVGDREKFLDAGMDGYVVKPIELESLRTVFADIRGGEKGLT
jgi:PAS domain S-box-containing protein